MFPLNQNSKLEAFLGSSPASNIQWSVGYIDLPPQTDAATEQQRGNTFRSVSNATSDVTICPYPGQKSGASTVTAGQPAWVRNVLYVKGYNPNAGAVTGTIQINDGNDDIQWTGSIPAGGTVYYEDKGGWSSRDSTGAILTAHPTTLSSLTVTGDVTISSQMGGYYAWDSWNPSDVAGTATNAPSTGTATANSNFVALVNSSGTVTATFAKAGKFRIRLTCGQTHANTYTVSRVTVTKGGTASLLSTTPSTLPISTGEPASDLDEFVTAEVVVNATASQTFTALPKFDLNGAGTTANHTAYANMCVDYLGG